MMKQKILEKAGDMFLKLGFKSVTMDDIANELGVSKKTIYKYFSNKDSLVRKCATDLHESVLEIINGIRANNFNPIKENFEIKKIFKEMFQNTTSSSPVYQLRKYYSDTYEKVMQKEIIIFSNCLTSNLQKGIQDGFYRKDIDIEVCTQFYFSIVFGIHENTSEIKKTTELEQKALEYHTRAIATEKGIQELENQLKNNPI